MNIIENKLIDEIVYLNKPMLVKRQTTLSLSLCFVKYGQFGSDNPVTNLTQAIIMIFIHHHDIIPGDFVEDLLRILS